MHARTVFDGWRSISISLYMTLVGYAVLVGVPAPNTEALDMLVEMGFEARPSSLRMRLGPAVAVGDLSRAFAISSGATG